MTKRAFCIHPLLQTDGELNSVGRHHVRSPLSAAFPVMLAMEYRARANDFLSDRIGIGGRGRIYEPAKTPEENREGPWVQDPPYIISGQPHPGKMPEVKLMLIADKVQNYKDFQQYHINTHPRRVELTYYFNLWLDVLGVDSKRYGEFCEMMKACQAA